MNNSKFQTNEKRENRLKTAETVETNAFPLTYQADKSRLKVRGELSCKQ
jgi:hypothetical protein